MASTEEMAKWAIENPTPGRTYAGRNAVMEHFGCTHHQATKAVTLARKAAAGNPTEPATITPPVLSGTRKFDPADPAYRAPTVEKLRKSSMALFELAEFMGTDQQNALLMITSLKSAGYIVEDIEGRFRIVGKLRQDTVPQMLTFERLRAPLLKIGIISDSHLCNVNQRLDVLETAYEEFKRQKVEHVLHCGNLIDGYRERINASEVMFRGVTDQALYAADHYPQRKGVVTRFITGDCHEGWYAASVGLHVGYHIQDTFRRHGRADLEWAGHMEADIELKCGSGSATLRMFHPGGGSAYAQSYKAQKIVESYQGGEKPAILLLGHFHKAGLFYPRGVWCVLAGCAEDQTRWMRGRHIEAHVSFAVLSIAQDKKGAVSKVVYESFPFYDKAYHYDAGEWESALYQALGK